MTALKGKDGLLFYIKLYIRKANEIDFTFFARNLQLEWQIIITKTFV